MDALTSSATLFMWLTPSSRWKLSEMFQALGEIASRPWSHTLNPGTLNVLQHNLSCPAALQMLWSTDEGHQSICKDIGYRMKLMSSEGTLNLVAPVPVSVHSLKVESGTKLLCIVEFAAWMENALC